MYLAHPLCITLCQVIVDGNDMYPFPLQRIQISRKRRYQGLTFTGFHFCNTSLVQNNSTDELYPVMLHIENSLGCFPYYRKRFRQKIIQGFPCGKSLFKLISLCCQLCVRKSLHGRTKLLDLVNQPFDPFQLPFTMCTKYLLNKIHMPVSSYTMFTKQTALSRAISP